MIEIDKILNSDAVRTLREALDSHVYWQLSDERYRNNGYVSAPGSDDPDALTKIWEACELDEVLSAIEGSYDSCAPALLEELRAEASKDPVTYRCACSWVGGDPDIGSGRGNTRFTVVIKPEGAQRYVFRRKGGSYAKSTDPTCPACWAKNKKRVIVTPEPATTEVRHG